MNIQGITMNTLATRLGSPPSRRVLYGALAAGLAGAAAAVVAVSGAGLWQALAFAAAPDLALLLGIGSNLDRGRLHPRAVAPYNALHRFWGPAALLAVVLAGVLPAGWAAGALAWGFHVAIDRALGYGLRAPDGSQRR